MHGVLHARVRRAAQRKSHGGDERTAAMPAAVVEKQDHADAAEKEVEEGDRVEGAQTYGGIQPGQQHMQRGEQQGLRIGNLRPAPEHIGRPPGPFAARKRARQKLHLRIELGFGIPRDAHRAGQPGPSR